MTWFQADKEEAMKKGSFIFLFCITVLLAGFSPKTAAARQDIPTFSNKDLEKYKSPSDNAPMPAPAPKVETTRTSTQQQREEMYWCRKAREYQKKIDRAQEKVKDAERLASEESGGQAFTESRMKKPTRRKYEKAKKELKEVRRELQYLEEDAHSKDVPPGWLRCQFE
jgi:hypothetical protein